MALTARLRPIPEAARKQFATIVEWAGYAGSDFTLLELGGGLMIEASVIVRRASNAAARTYAIGDGTQWLACFKRDLDGGVYGRR
jgi:hypothetical protein